ncbi:MAG TPA: transcriptional regulator [Phycisphaerae bacterium]|nr:transcriptional regulator [Phycisphaerae bacterium]HDZ43347.1 transcriptional regulator [Phycisphaerae bacterium]
MVTLAGVGSLEFNGLKGQLGLSDGNLSTHAGALERAGFVKIIKRFRGRKPQTTLAITAKGRKALTNYINLLQGILSEAT